MDYIRLIEDSNHPVANILFNIKENRSKYNDRFIHYIRDICEDICMELSYQIDISFEEALYNIAEDYANDIIDYNLSSNHRLIILLYFLDFPIPNNLRILLGERWDENERRFIGNFVRLLDN